MCSIIGACTYSMNVISMISNFFDGKVAQRYFLFYVIVFGLADSELNELDASIPYTMDKL